MKIKKGEFVQKFSWTQTPETFIKEIVKPFSPIIKNREIKVTIIMESKFRQLKLFSDWRNY
jgi:hypothetical protein